MRARPFVFAAALAAAAAGRASAELALDGVHWQVGRVEHARVAAWQDVRVVADGPPKLVNRLRVHLLLRNRGPKAVEGVLLRYSMTARLSPGQGPAAEGTWAIPFSVDEKRIPLVGAGKTVEVTLDTSPALDLYLRRLARAGWWPDRLKMQVMLEPHPGSGSIQTGEDTVELQR
jgi:hypothetical protein